MHAGARWRAVYTGAALALALAGCGGSNGPVDAATPADLARADAPATDAPAVVVTGTVGPEGAELRGDGIVLRIPQGALDRAVMLRAENTGTAPPPPYVGYSNVWRFTPEGLTFARPVTVSIRFRPGADPTIAWSRAGAEGYEWRESEAAGDTISARVDHFSTGFVAGRERTDASTADASTADAPTPDAPTPDVPVTDASIPDVPVIDVADVGAGDVPGVDTALPVDVGVFDGGLDAPSDVNRADVPVDAPAPVDAPISPDVVAPDILVTGRDVYVCRAPGPPDAAVGTSPDTCPGLELVPNGPMLSVNTSLLRMGNDVGTSCSGAGTATAFQDAVLHFRLDGPRDVTVVVDGRGAGYTFAQIQCSCARDATPLTSCRQAPTHVFSRRALPAGDYYVIVELVNPTGSFGVELRTSAPTTLPAGELCALPQEVTPDGAAAAVTASQLETDVDVGISCATPVDHGGNSDAIWHFRLDTTRDVTIVTSGGPDRIWWRLQRWGCASDSTVAGDCVATGSSSLRTFPAQTPGDYYLVGEWPPGFAGVLSVSVSTAPTAPRQQGDLCSNPVAVTPDGPTAMVPVTNVAVGIDTGLRCAGGDVNGSNRRDASFVYTLTETRDVVVSVSDAGDRGTVYFEVQPRCGEWASDAGRCRWDDPSSIRELVLPRQGPGTWFIGALATVASSAVTARVRTYPAGTFNTYAISNPQEVNWVTACGAPGASVILPSGSNVQVALPFAFRYWGTALPVGFSANVSHNGFMNLDGVAATTATALPGLATPNGMVAPAPDNDWGLRAPGICSVVLGVAPNRRWVVQWNNRTTPIVGSGTPADFEVILNEGSNAIDFVYGAGATRGAVVGLENLAGTDAITWDFPTPSGTRVRFTPTR
ncbi:MAG: hypothetical protein Q8S73_19300 [Deltaproteobacteria bacterium]|nr:hypothetical protein [Myxococcales bacterium]MDP3216264.1 hypothetical protein [Deltaproteobacteria bacterium]